MASQVSTTRNVDSPAADSPAPRVLDDVLSLGAGLTLVLILAKLLLLPFPVSTPADFVRWLLRLAVVVAPDICFAAGLTLAALVSVRLLDGRPRILSWLRWFWFAAFYLCGAYAVASISIYRWTMVPLTLPLISYAGGPSTMASSLEACLTLDIVLVLLFAPTAVLLLPRLLRRRLTLPREIAASPRLLGGTLALIAAYGMVCQGYVLARWTDPNRWERRIAQSPHYVLLSSCLVEVFSNGDPLTALDLQEVDDRDFTQLRQVKQPPLALNSKSRPKNVLLILLESTSAEYLSLYGGPHETTPELQRLVSQGGVVMENAYVQSPNSCKSLVSLTAGVLPRLDWGLIVRDAPEFAVPTLPQVLSQRGYRTCYAHSGYWSWKERDAFLKSRGVQQLLDAENIAAPQVNSWGVSDRAMFQSVLNWIDEDRSQPFYALAYTIETHHPYVASGPLTEFGVKDEDFNRYLNALRRTDETIGWVMGELRKRGLDESTLVVVTADHGESFGQHGQRIHSFSVHETAVHVPLVLLHPSLRHAPRRISAVRQHIDIVPTIADLLGVPRAQPWQGRNLLEEEPGRAYFFATGNDVVLGLRDGGHKYHYYVDGGYQELFDLARDPGEQVNLAAEAPAKCREYQKRLAGMIRYQRAFLKQHGGL